MRLYIKTVEGKEVELHPSWATREEMARNNGFLVYLGKSDVVYNVGEVYAKPDPETSFWASLIVFFIFLAILSFDNAIVIGIVFYIFSKIYFYFDRKAATKFNLSKTDIAWK